MDLINVRYQLSKYHSKSQKIVTDEERLYELVPMLMINFKYAIVTEELKHMLYALQDPALAHDNEKCNSLMQRYNEMREVQSLMAKRLGRPRCITLNFSSVPRHPFIGTGGNPH